MNRSLAVTLGFFWQVVLLVGDKRSCRRVAIGCAGKHHLHPRILEAFQMALALCKEDDAEVEGRCLINVPVQPVRHLLCKKTGSLLRN
jgi:hypothetical protein